MIPDALNIYQKQENHDFLQDSCLWWMNHANTFIGMSEKLYKMATNLNDTNAINETRIDLKFDEDQFNSYKFYEI